MRYQTLILVKGLQKHHRSLTSDIFAAPSPKLQFKVQFLQSYHKMSTIKVAWYVFIVRNMRFWAPTESWGQWGEAQPSYVITLHYQARRSHVTDTKTHPSIVSPPHCRSQAVMCFSTHRMYPRSGYFLVHYYFNNLFCLSFSLAVHRIAPVSSSQCESNWQWNLLPLIFVKYYLQIWIGLLMLPLRVYVYKRLLK